MGITATELRRNIYKLLDQVIETGEALEIERNGKILRISPPQGRDLEKLFPRRDDIYNGDSEELVHMDWSDTWKPWGVE